MKTVPSGKGAPVAGGFRLAELEAGRGAVVAGVAGGRGAEGRLLALGLVPGQRVRMLKNDGAGPVILAVGATRLAIGRGLAGKVRLRGGEPT